MANRDSGRGRDFPDRDFDRAPGGTSRGWQGSEYRTDPMRNEPDLERGEGAGNRDDWNRAQWDQGDWSRGRGDYGYGGQSGGQYGGQYGGGQRYGGQFGGSQYGDEYRSSSGGMGTGYGSWGGPSYGGSPSRGEPSRQSHYGRGPRNYRRSDERIREEINERLTRHPDIDASDVEVQVTNGEVVLAGIVEDRPAKRLAEDIVEDIFGVADVQNNLKVRRGLLAGLTGEKADDREIRRAAAREGTATSATSQSHAGTAATASGASRTRTTSTTNSGSNP